MSTPYTLMRCRMKDLISCFNACKVPIEKDADQSDSQKPNTSNRNPEREKHLKVETTSESPVSWQSCESEEDEYIVFYFKDDDAGGDVIEERGLDADCCNRRNKVTNQESTSKIKGGAINEFELELEQHRHTFSESSESSAGSFAFPTIQREWPGSPVLMPRPEAHKKSCGVCIQCCKF